MSYTFQSFSQPVSQSFSLSFLLTQPSLIHPGSRSLWQPQFAKLLLLKMLLKPIFFQIPHQWILFQTMSHFLALHGLPYQKELMQFSCDKLSFCLFMIHVFVLFVINSWPVFSVPYATTLLAMCHRTLSYGVGTLKIKWYCCYYYYNYYYYYHYFIFHPHFLEIS